MRRTRHVVLPVRSWQYIGLLIVSLACLTLGLVSRDREGHSGSLAGPELTHQAPHESIISRVDACPNLNPLVKLPAHLITKPEEAPKPINDHEIKVSKSPISQRFVLSRSLSLDRLSTIGARKIEERSKNLRMMERLSRSRTRVSDESNRLRESRFRTIKESRNARNSFDPARLSRSQDLSNRATDRRSIARDFERRVADRTNSRSRSTERRELNEIAHRQNRVDRSAGRRNSLESRTNDRRSLSMERRGPSEINRQEYSRDILAGRRDFRDLTRTRVDHRSEIRERRLQSIERRDSERLNRRENRRILLKTRSENVAREDIDRNNNLNRRNREQFLENRRALVDRVANQERRSRVSIVARNSRGDLVRSNDRRLQSRSMERVNDFDRETLRRVRSIESNIERSNERRLSSERRSLARSVEINRIEHRRVENRLTGPRSLDRTMPRVSEDVRRERINRSQRIVSQRDSRGNAARENSRTIPARSLYGFGDISSRERRERQIRSSRSVDRRELAKIKESRDRKSHDSSTVQRDLTLERRERTNRVYRSREERRIVPQQSREQIEQRVSRRASERRVLERRDSRRSTDNERRIDENARSREASRMTDRRLERNSELRMSHGRILEKRSTVNSRKSFERRIDDSSISLERYRTQNRRVERNSELRNTIPMRVMDRRVNRAATYERRVLHSLEKRSDARRGQQARSLEERRLARSVENRLAESPEKDSIRQLRQRSSNLNVKDSSRLASLRRDIRASHNVPQQNREQRTLFAERTISSIRRIASNNRLSTKWERNSQDASIEKIGIAKIIPKSMDYEFFKYPTTYDFMRQAFVVALCTVYGLSLYNGKKTFIGNMAQQMQRFILW
ncbi:uncharacterized protein [Anoplolepis gracilipes]|uniref:uncharacterized protein isoform X2 n=1 Tax=Anoplolepis gracilipes TaxID=354296 RepID=UPI003BA0AE94